MSDYETALQRWLPQPAAPNAGGDDDVFGSARADAELAGALERVREWTRTRFALPPEAAISVSEVACRLPGCPPLETVVVFWDKEQRHHFKLFKRAAQVAADDLPFTWLKDTLVVPEGFECECC